MRILIVEDDDEKCAKLLEFVHQKFNVLDVISARSLHSGLLAIMNEKPNFIILDMTMRTYDRSLIEDGGRPHPFGGREILRQMKRNRIATPVVVVTHFDRFGEEKDYMTLEQLKHELQSRFPNYLGAVQYRSNVDSWKVDLFAVMSAVVGVKLETGF